MTSISALSSNLITDLSRQQRQNPFQEIKQDFHQLASALKSGDLSGAQSAYSNIQQLIPGNPDASTSSTASNGSNTPQNDFATLGQALQSGDLSQAQSAFSQLRTDVRSAFAQPRSQTQATAQPNDQFIPSSSQSSSSAQGPTPAQSSSPAQASTPAQSSTPAQASSPAQGAAAQNPIEEALQDYSQLASSL